MTPFFRWFTRVREKWLGKFYEGPHPPDRVREMVVMFANAHPRATRAEWVEFTVEHARETYRTGYVRGVEHTDRDPDADAPTPDQVADYLTPGWQNSEPIRLDNPNAVPPETIDPHKEMQRAMDRMMEEGEAERERRILARARMG